MKSKYERAISLIILGLLTLSLLSFDYSYFTYSHKVKHNESLWSVLTYDVFNNVHIADHSIKFMKATDPLFDYDYIQANTSQFSDDGDIIKIWGGKLFIFTPGGELRLQPTYLLPRHAVRNHNIQITYQNLLLLFIAGIGFYTIIKRKEVKGKKFLEKMPQILLFSFFVGSFIRWCISFAFAYNLFPVHYEGPLQSSVFVFQNILIMICALTFLTSFFIYKKYKNLGIGFGIFLMLYVIATIYLLNTPRL
jgi:hypothetical protein